MAVEKNVELGKNVKIFHPELVNLYGCSVGDNTKIGAFVEIQKGATIGNECKVSSHTFICEGVHIHDKVFIGHGVMFINDLYPRATNEKPKQPIEIKPHPYGVELGILIKMLQITSARTLQSFLTGDF